MGTSNVRTPGSREENEILKKAAIFFARASVHRCQSIALRCSSSLPGTASLEEWLLRVTQSAAECPQRTPTKADVEDPRYPRGKVKPVIDGPYKLSQVPEAFRHFGEGRHKGKVVITVEQLIGARPPRAAAIRTPAASGLQEAGICGMPRRHGPQHVQHFGDLGALVEEMFGAEAICGVAIPIAGEVR